MTNIPNDDALTTFFKKIMSDEKNRPKLIAASGRLLETHISEKTGKTTKNKSAALLLQAGALLLVALALTIMQINSIIEKIENALKTSSSISNYTKHILSFQELTEKGFYTTAISILIVMSIVSLIKSLKKDDVQNIIDIIEIIKNGYFKQYKQAEKTYINEKINKKSHKEKIYEIKKDIRCFIKSIYNSIKIISGQNKPINTAIIAESIFRKRQELRYTQQQLADASGMTIRTVQRVEKTGEGSPETLRNLCATLDINLSNAPDKNSRIEKIRYHLAWTVGSFIASIPATLILKIALNSIITEENNNATSLGIIAIFYQIYSLPTVIGLSFSTWNIIKIYQIYMEQEKNKIINNIAFIIPSVIISLSTIYNSMSVVSSSIGIYKIVQISSQIEQYKYQNEIIKSAINLSKSEDEKNCINAFGILYNEEIYLTNKNRNYVFNESSKPKKLTFFKTFWDNYDILTNRSEYFLSPLKKYKDPSSYAKEIDVCYNLSNKQ